MHVKLNRVVGILKLVFAEMNLKIYSITFIYVFIINLYFFLCTTQDDAPSPTGHHRHLFNFISSAFDQAASDDDS